MDPLPFPGPASRYADRAEVGPAQVMVWQETWRRLEVTVHCGVELE